MTRWFLLIAIVAAYLAARPALASTDNVSRMLVANNDVATLPLDAAVQAIINSYPGNFIALRGSPLNTSPTYFSYIGKIVPVGFHDCSAIENLRNGKALYGYQCDVATGGSDSPYSASESADMMNTYIKCISAVQQLEPSISFKKYIAADSSGGSAMQSLGTVTGGPMITIMSTKLTNSSGKETLREVMLDIHTPYDSITGNPWTPAP